jgi:hypothetical protein
VQPSCIEQVVALSIAQVLSVPVQGAVPVDQRHPCWAAHVVMSTNVEHDESVPLHWVVHEHPLCAAQVGCVANVRHDDGVPEHDDVAAFHVHPDWAMQVPCARKL